MRLQANTVWFILVRHGVAEVPLHFHQTLCTDAESIDLQHYLLKVRCLVNDAIFITLGSCTQCKSKENPTITPQEAALSEENATLRNPAYTTFTHNTISCRGSQSLIVYR